MSKFKCEFCDEKAVFEEYCPDGSPYYYCSANCCADFHVMMKDKGIIWRASIPRRIKNE